MRSESFEDYKTGEVAILFPCQERPYEREYLARAAVWPLEGTLTLPPEAAQGNGSGDAREGETT